jgi:hypothetical protein
MTDDEHTRRRFLRRVGTGTATAVSIGTVEAGTAEASEWPECERGVGRTGRVTPADIGADAAPTTARGRKRTKRPIGYQYL